MIPWWGLAVLICGVNFALWGSIGLCRLAGELPGWLRRRTGVQFRRGGGEGRPSRSAVPAVRDVAVLIPAHNEAVMIAGTLRSIMALVPRENVHVVSDGSTDGTAAIARRAGVNVIETRTNVGKANALQEGITRFRLAERFRILMLLDADTRVEPGYFRAGLPLFASPEVVAVAGCVRTLAGRQLGFAGNVLAGHRQRIYAIGQRMLKFGQTWLHTNATHIVPGFASMYRASVLPQIELNPPGLVIEDFNMTFEVYQKRLGKVGFTLGAVAQTQDPDNFRDYIRQTRRWALGLWQTVRRHPPRANLFTVMLTLLLLELITSSLLLLLLPLLLLVLVLPELITSAVTWPVEAELHPLVTAHMTLTAVVLGIVVPDLSLTCVVAAIERRPRLLLYGVFFLGLRVVDAAIALWAIPLAWLPGSGGRWQSPARRPVSRTAVRARPASGRPRPAKLEGAIYTGKGPHASG